MLEKILSDIIGEVLETICRYSDPHGFDRDEVLFSVAEMLTAMSEICTIKDYEVN